MLGSKEFFEELRNGDEYLTCFMTKEVYSGIELEFRERIGVSEVREKNDRFKNDPEHQILLKASFKAKRELGDYEYNINHKARNIKK